jgi:hypothetical protein
MQKIFLTKGKISIVDDIDMDIAKLKWRAICGKSAVPIYRNAGRRPLSL